MDIVTSLATVPAILALVEVAKQLGSTGRWNTLLAIFFGVASQVAEYAVFTEVTSAAGWYEAGASGLLLGLGAAGVYDAMKIASRTEGEVPRRALIEDEVAVPSLPKAGV